MASPGASDRRRSISPWRRTETRPKFLIVGTGRSGTGYLAKTLCAMQVRTGHEDVYGPDAKGWKRLDGEASWMAVPFLDDFTGPVAHIVRDPRQVIGSLLGIGFFEHAPDQRFLRYAVDAIPGLMDEPDPMDRACTFWVHWIDAAERGATHTQRLEELDWPGLLDHLGHARSPAQIAQAVREVPTDVNQRPRSQVAWSELPDAVLERAERLGYALQGQL